MSNSTAADTFLASTRKFLDLPSEPEARNYHYTELLKEWRILFKELPKKAEDEGQEAWFALGHGYNNGWGAERDPVASEAWFRRAASEGHPRAMMRLASLLKRSGRSESLEEGMSWLFKSASLDEPGAMVKLGFAFQEGRGVKEDLATAAEWFMKAYQSGDKHAAIHVARVFASEPNQHAEAEAWYRKAADARQTESYIGLAMLYDDRHSSLYDPVEAVRWYEATVANEGSNIPRAMLELARHHRDGIGVPAADKDRARDWAERFVAETQATHQFHKVGVQLLDDLRSSLL